MISILITFKESIVIRRVIIQRVQFAIIKPEGKTSVGETEERAGGKLSRPIKRPLVRTLMEGMFRKVPAQKGR